MGKFFSRFAIGAALGLALMWLLGQLKQHDDDDSEDDDEVIEIQIGGKPTVSSSINGASAEKAKVSTTTSDTATKQSNAADAGAAAVTAADASNNLEWVDGIGPVFNGILAEHGINTNEDLAKASVEQLRETGINRNDDEFASWIAQAKDKIAGK